MRVAGAIDIGNATTEVLIAELDRRGTSPVWDVRAPTQGSKGDERSIRAAVELLDRGEEVTGLRCEEIAITRLRPVESVAVTANVGPTIRGPATAVPAAEAQTTAGHGAGVGELIPIGDLDRAPRGADLVIDVPAALDFEVAARRIQSALGSGLRIVGALVAGDDAVLIHNRIEASIPIVDEVEIDDVPPGSRVVVEVAGPGAKLTTLGDPVALAATLGLGRGSARELQDLARSYVDRNCGAVALPRGRRSVREKQDWAPWVEGPRIGRLPLGPETSRRLGQSPVGSVDLAQLDRRQEPLPVSDLSMIDLIAMDRGGLVRRGVIDASWIPCALLRSDAPVDPRDRIEELTGRPVSLVAEETEAAWTGALSTPAADPEAHVLDLGGGTIDIAGITQVAAAGAGELLTVAVAAALGIPRPVAEEIKRGPLVRVEGPQLVHLEDGGRRYLEATMAPEVVGRLVRLGGARVAAFDLPLAPEEWRGLRLALKEGVLGANVERILDTLDEAPREILTAGGAAEDEELVQILGERLRPRGIVVGRANVGGRFGPRHAVTFGLMLMLTKEVGDHVG